MENNNSNKNRKFLYWGIVILAIIILITVASALMNKSKYPTGIKKSIGLTEEEKARILNQADRNAVPVVLSDSELEEILNEESSSEPVVLSDEEAKKILSQ